MAEVPLGMPLPGLAANSDSEEEPPRLASRAFSLASASDQLDNPPDLLSDASTYSDDSGAGGEPPWPHRENARAGSFSTTTHAPPPLAHLDEIDRSEGEEEDLGLGYEFDEFGRGRGGLEALLGQVVPQQLEEYLQDPGLNEGLLMQIPVQDLLGIVMRSGSAGLLGTDSDGAGWGFEAMGPGGVIPGLRIPDGLDPSALRHAQQMAAQGFATALDPARHAARAAEGIPGGRRQPSPTPPANRGQYSGSSSAAGPGPAVAARGGAGGPGGVGRAAAPLSRTLQRVDSASGSGGLQRGDSAASQGGSGSLRRAMPALVGQASSRLAGRGRPHGLGRQHRASSEEGSGAGGSSGSDASLPGLVASSGSEEDEGGPGAAALRQVHAAPPQRRPRRNAVFGTLPGLAGGVLARAPAPADGSDGGGRRRRLLLSVNLPGEAWGAEEGGPPPLQEGSDSEWWGGAASPRLRGARGEAPQLAHDNLGWGGGGGGDSERGDGPPALLAPTAWLGPAPAAPAQPAARPAPPAGATTHQRVVMQALVSLLPQQGDARGWADLAAMAGRHAAGASGGGVRLLARLVAAAADRFPAEAEAAGLTERPLGPPPPALGSPLSAAALSPRGGGAGAEGSSAEARLTFVVGSPRAAAQLQGELGPGVAVVAEGHPRPQLSPGSPVPAISMPRVTLALPSAQAAAELRRHHPGEWVELLAEEELLAGQRFAAGVLASGEEGPGSEARASGQAAGVAAVGAGPQADGGAPLAAAAVLATPIASVRAQAGQPSVVGTEAALRMLAEQGVAAQQPLPPLVAAAVAAAAGPAPEQAEE